MHHIASRRHSNASQRWSNEIVFFPDKWFINRGISHKSSHKDETIEFLFCIISGCSYRCKKRSKRCQDVLLRLVNPSSSAASSFYTQPSLDKKIPWKRKLSNSLTRLKRCSWLAFIYRPTVSAIAFLVDNFPLARPNLTTNYPVLPCINNRGKTQTRW